MKKALNDRLIGSLKRAADGKRYSIMDTVVPSFGVRVTDTGSKSYILVMRPPRTRNPTRRVIGAVGALTLQAARAKAREWLEQITAGVDPKEAAAAKAKAAVIFHSSAFVQVAKEYIAKMLSGNRTAKYVANDIRRTFGGIVDGKPVGPWAKKQVGDIATTDITEIIDTVAKKTPSQAHHVLGYIRRLFAWAVVKGIIPRSPGEVIKPSLLLKAKPVGDRVLDDAELRKVWLAAGELGYPFGSLYRVLILCGLRKNEAAKAHRSEFDMQERLWTIPAARMKNKLDHLIPLSGMAYELIESLPRHNQGDYLFSTTAGERPTGLEGKIKDRMYGAVGFSNWVNHDLRRTMRTNLSRLPIEEHVRELMVAHKRKGISGVYDKHQYLDEKRKGFDLWEKQLAQIVMPSLPLAA